jgi:hypothetical protein
MDGDLMMMDDGEGRTSLEIKEKRGLPVMIDGFFRRDGNTSAAIDRKIVDEAKWQKGKKMWDSNPG